MLMPQSRHGDILSHYANVDFEQKLTFNNFRCQQIVRFGIISYDIKVQVLNFQKLYETISFYITSNEKLEVASTATKN